VVRKNLAWAAAAHAEVKRVAADRVIDLVSAPVWDCEGLFCHLDDDLKTVLSLHTTVKTTADLNPSWQIDPGVQDLIGIERFVVRHNRHLTAPSHDILRKVKRDYGAPVAPAAGHVIYHGLPDRAGRYRPRAADGKVRVLTVGRLEKRKGTDLFLEAAALLGPEFPAAEFVLVGDDTIPMEGNPGTTYKDYFRARFGGEPWARQVVFTGKVSEDRLYAEYAGCDVFCLPARYESFGLVLVEAMVFGKPVVAAAAGGMPEVVADGQTGVLVYPDSARSLADHLRPLLADPGLRARLGAAARRRYEEEFRLDAMVRNTVRVYTEMAESFAA
jgi:glycosyltransferase involved in cell wall biosynthesis